MTLTPVWWQEMLDEAPTPEDYWFWEQEEESDRLHELGFYDEGGNE